MTKSDLVDIEVVIHAETDKAIKVSNDGEKANAVWLPKSMIEIEPNLGIGIVIISLPERLALDKGLI